MRSAAGGGVTTFVGRDTEMDTLFTALEQAKAGKGQLVAVIGEPGVGKPTTHLGPGTLYRRTGKPEQAQEHLTTATTMYREMGMTYWLEQAESEAMELGA